MSLENEALLIEKRAVLTEPTVDPDDPDSIWWEVRLLTFEESNLVSRISPWPRALRRIPGISNMERLISRVSSPQSKIIPFRRVA